MYPLKTFLMTELLAGLRVTLKHLFTRKSTVHYPEEKNASVRAVSGAARTSPVPERPRAMHRVQALRSGVPGRGDYDRVRRR